MRNLRRLHQFVCGRKTVVSEVRRLQSTRAAKKTRRTGFRYTGESVLSPRPPQLGHVRPAVASDCSMSCPDREARPKRQACKAGTAAFVYAIGTAELRSARRREVEVGNPEAPRESWRRFTGLAVSTAVIPYVPFEFTANSLRLEPGIFGNLPQFLICSSVGGAHFRAKLAHRKGVRLRRDFVPVQ